MRKFWTYISNGEYSVGCSGATVYVYDKEGEELARFKDFPYGYDAVFCPGRNLIAVKSAASYLGFYNLDDLKLEKKILVGKNKRKSKETQDDGCCFSPDGKFFINLEANENFYYSIVVYDMNFFEEVKRYDFKNDISFSVIEYNQRESCYLVLGYWRFEEENVYFIAKFCEGRIFDIRELEEERYDYIFWYKEIESSGFTEKSIEWFFRNQKIIKHTLEQAYNGELSDEAVYRWNAK